MANLIRAVETVVQEHIDYGFVGVMTDAVNARLAQLLQMVLPVLCAITTTATASCSTPTPTPLPAPLPAPFPTGMR
jgi:acetylglutamate kinase